MTQRQFSSNISCLLVCQWSSIRGRSSSGDTLKEHISWRKRQRKTALQRHIIREGRRSTVEGTDGNALRKMEK